MDRPVRIAVVNAASFDSTTDNKSSSKSSRCYTMLEESLTPLWKITHYTGLLFDWCLPLCEPKFSFAKILRFVTTFTFFTFNILAVVTLTATQVMEAKEQGLQQKVANLTTNSLMLINFVMHTSLFFFNKKSLSIFKDFKENLANLNLSAITETKPKHGLKKRLLFIYAIYFLAATALIYVNLHGAIKGLISSITSETMNSKSLLGISYPVISVFYKTTNIMTYFFITMADILPTFIYYNAAQAVEILREQLLRLFNLASDKDGKKNSLESINGIIEKETERISHLYDSIVNVVFRADHFLGPTVVLNQGITFVAVCATAAFLVNDAYNNYNGNKNPDASKPYNNSMIVYLVVFIFRLVWPILFMSKLNNSASRLRSIVIPFQSKSYYKNLSYSERKTLRYFLDQLRDDNLAACPSGLYNITPSMLLIMLNLVVTYTIILLQSGNS